MVSRNFHGMDRQDSLHGVSKLCAWALEMQLVVAKARHMRNGLDDSHLSSKRFEFVCFFWWMPVVMSCVCLFQTEMASTAESVC